MPYVIRVLLGATAVLAIGCTHGSGTVGVTEEERAGHDRMLRLLEDLRSRVDRQNLYLGTQLLERRQRELGEVDEHTPRKTVAQLHFEIGKEQAQLGQIEEGIASLKESYRILEQFPRDQWPPFSENLAYEIGVALMRFGEDVNCVASYNKDACLLPIEGGGVHADKRPSEEALGWLREAHQGAPEGSREKLAARWSLNIAAQTLGRHPDALLPEERISTDVFSSEAEFPRFLNVAPECGLDTFDLCGGAILEDFDGDGLLDVMVSTWDPRGQMHLYHNTGEGDFVDRTADAGLLGLYGGLNMVSGDYNGDGFVDVFVPRGGWLAGERGKHPNSLLRNNGDGTFVDVTFGAGVDESHQTQTAGWADYDLDGDLDLFVGNESPYQDTIASQLFRNEGDGTFLDVAEAAGVTNLGFSKGVAWGDYDADGYPDLFVSNLGGPNRLYRNLGDGTFEDVAGQLGLELPLWSFTAWFWDFDNDGNLDLYVSTYYQGSFGFGSTFRHAPVIAGYLGLEDSDFGAEAPCLYRGDGRGGFLEVAEQRGVARITLTMGANFGDLDNDGFLDFYLGTGYPHYDGLIPNLMYWNRGGERFLDITRVGGFGLSQKGHGVAFGDLDQDGDQDVFELVGGAYEGDRFGNVLFENPGFGNHWVKLELRGTESNRRGVGARLRVDVTEGGVPRSIYRWVGTGGSFGCGSFVQHVGVGQAERIDALEIRWPRTGAAQVLRDLPVDRTLEIVEGAGAPRVREEAPFTLGG